MRKARPDGLNAKVTHPGSGRADPGLCDSRFWAGSRSHAHHSLTVSGDPEARHISSVGLSLFICEVGEKPALQNDGQL